MVSYVFFLVESGMFHKTVPNETFPAAAEDFGRGKSPKGRLTAIFSTNICGTDEECFLIIGKSKSFHYLKNSAVDTDSTGNRATRMAGGIFNK